MIDGLPQNEQEILEGLLDRRKRNGSLPGLTPEVYAELREILRFLSAYERWGGDMGDRSMSACADILVEQGRMDWFPEGKGTLRTQVPDGWSERKTMAVFMLTWAFLESKWEWTQGFLMDVPTVPWEVAERWPRS